MQITTNQIAISAMLITAGGLWYTEFRSSQRELFNAKKSAYADLLTASEELLEASMSGSHETDRYLKASYQMNEALAVVDLMAPKVIYQFARDVEEFALLTRRSERRDEYFDKLQEMMRSDLKKHQKGLRSRILTFRS